jgi:hypothetical protein
VKNWLFIGNEESGQKCAILMETSEEWETGKVYLNLSPQNRIPNTQKPTTNIRLKSASKSILKTFTDKKLRGRPLPTGSKPAAGSRSVWQPDFISVIDLQTMTPMNTP